MALRHRPAPALSPRSRQTPASARCRVLRAGVRCRPPDPRWCCRAAPRAVDSRRSRADQTARCDSARGSKKRRIAGSVPPPGPPCRNTTGLPSDVAALLVVELVQVRDTQVRLADTGGSADKDASAPRCECVALPRRVVSPAVAHGTWRPDAPRADGAGALKPTPSARAACRRAGGSAGGRPPDRHADCS